MNWSEEQIQAVWNKGRIPIQTEAANWRQDACTAWMQRTAYGNRNSSYGWEIDHINPNDGDGLANLQPLQWENNAAKSDGPLVYAVTSSGNKNVSAKVSA